MLAGRVAGEQGIHRAELLAVVRLGELFRNTHTHSDSTVTLSAVAACQTAVDSLELHTRADFDLLLRLHAVMDDNRRFFKVTAHAEDDKGLDPLTLYHRLGNKAANDYAIQTCKGLNKQLVDSMTQMHMELQVQQQHLGKLFEFHHEANLLHASLRKQRQAEPRQPEPQPQHVTGQQLVGELGTYAIQDPWICAEPELTFPSWLGCCCNGSATWNGCEHLTCTRCRN